MSCNIQIFDKQISFIKADEITIEKVYSAFEEYVLNNLGTNFTFENNIFTVTGQVKPLHEQLLLEVNDRFKTPLFKKIDDKNYIFDNEVVGKIVAASYDTIQKKALSIEVLEESPISFSPATEGEVFRIDNFIANLKYQETKLFERLSDIQNQLRDKKFSTQKELESLHRDLIFVRKRLFGDKEQGITGIREDIKNLEKEDYQTYVFIEQTAIKALQRLDELAVSVEGRPPTAANRKEAMDIIEFYTSVGEFDPEKTNPLFDRIAKRDMPKATRLRFEELASQFKKKKESFTESNKEHVIDILMNATSFKGIDIQKMFYEIYNKHIETPNMEMTDEEKTRAEFRELFEHLFTKEEREDIDLLSFLISDHSRNFNNRNNIVAQIQMNRLTDEIDELSAIAKDYEERLNLLSEEVSKILHKKGKNMSIFRQKNSRGGFTGRFISRFTADYFSEMERLDEISKKDDTIVIKRRNWYNENTILVDIRYLYDDIIKGQPFENDSRITKERGVFKNDNGKHKAELIALLGQRGYEEIIEEQREKIQNYITQINALEKSLFINYKEDLGEGEVTLEDLLNIPIAEQAYRSFEIKNPFRQLEYYEETDFEYIKAFKKEFITFIPKNKKDYDSDYYIIENDKILKEYYDLAVEMLYITYTAMPHDIQKLHNPLDLLSMKESLLEDIINPRTGYMYRLLAFLSKLYREMIAKVMGLIRKKRIDFLSTDYNVTTGKYEPKINAKKFFKTNKFEINKMFEMEVAEFQQMLVKDFNTIKEEDEYDFDTMVGSETIEIKKYTKIEIADLTERAKVKLAELLGLKLTNIEQQLRELYGENIPVGKIIYDDIVNRFMLQETLDITRLLNFSLLQALTYRGKKAVEADINLMEEMYRRGDVDEKNSSEKLWADTRADQWMKEAIYDDFSKQESTLSLSKILGLLKRKNKRKKPEEKRPDTYFDKRKKLLTPKEKEQVKRINKILQNQTGLTEKQRIRLEIMKDNIGGVFSAEKLFMSNLNLTRWVGLAYNYYSDHNNYKMGQYTVSQLDAQGTHWTTGNYYKTRNTMRVSTLKFLSHGMISSKTTRMIRTLTDKWDAFQDPTNELQQSKRRKKAHKHFGMVGSPYEHVARIEYLNQTPIILCIMMDFEIQDEEGNTRKLIDAFDDKGKLKPGFRTQKNIDNWERPKKGSMDDFLAFKQKVRDATETAAGIYDSLKGNMFKSTLAGNFLGMFKANWFFTQLYDKYHAETYNIKIHKKTKGRFRSNTTSMTVQGSFLTSIAAGVGAGSLLGLGLGFGAVAAIGALGLRYVLNRSSGKAPKMTFHKYSIVSTLLENLFITRMVLQNAIGIPVNKWTSHYIIKDADLEKLMKRGLSEIDARNIRSNLRGMGNQVGTIVMLLIANLLKNSWGDDDDDDNETKLQKRVKRITSGTYFLPTREELLNYYINTYNENLRNIQLYSNPMELARFWNAESMLRTTNNLIKLTGELAIRVAHPIEDFNQVTYESRSKTTFSKLLPAPYKALYMKKLPAKFQKEYEENLFTFLQDEVQEKKEKLTKQKEREALRLEILTKNPNLPLKDVQKKIDEALPTKAQTENKKKKKSTTTITKTRRSGRTEGR